MPTISESAGPARIAPPPMTVERCLAGILAEMRERGIRPTPLALIALGTDRGLPEHVVVEMAARLSAIS